MEQNHFYRLQIVQFECPKVRNPYVSFTYGEFPFPVFSPCEVNETKGFQKVQRYLTLGIQTNHLPGTRLISLKV